MTMELTFEKFLKGAPTIYSDYWRQHGKGVAKQNPHLESQNRAYCRQGNTFCEQNISVLFPVFAGGNFKVHTAFTLE